MRITPLELRSHRFTKRLNGIDPEEVQAFLEMVAEDFEALVREKDAIGERAHVLESQLKDLQAQETLLQETLISAQAMSQDLRQTAVKESEVLLAEAELRAEKIIDAAHRRSAQLAEEIREMRQIRSRLASALRSTIETHVRIIDSLESGPEAEIVDAPSFGYRARSSDEAPSLPELVPEDD